MTTKVDKSSSKETEIDSQELPETSQLLSELETRSRSKLHSTLSSPFDAEKVEEQLQDLEQWGLGENHQQQSAFSELPHLGIPQEGPYQQLFEQAEQAGLTLEASHNPSRSHTDFNIIKDGEVVGTITLHMFDQMNPDAWRPALAGELAKVLGVPFERDSTPLEEILREAMSNQMASPESPSLNAPQEGPYQQLFEQAQQAGLTLESSHNPSRSHSDFNIVKDGEVVGTITLHMFDQMNPDVWRKRLAKELERLFDNQLESFKG